MMRNRLFLLALGLIFCNIAGAQTYNWTKTISGTDDQVVTDVKIDKAGNVIMVANFRNQVDADPGSGTKMLSSAGKNDFIVTKWTADGTEIWTKQFGGAGNDYVSDMEIDANDNIYISGTFEKTMDFDPGAGTDTLNPGKFANLFMLKLNKAGDYKWVRRLECFGNAFWFESAIDADNNLFVTGGFKDTIDLDPTAALSKMGSKGDYDGMVISLDSSGNHRWTKVIGGTGTQSLTALCLDKNKMVNLVGTSNGTADLNPDAGNTPFTNTGNSDMYFVRLSSQGFFQFSKVFAGSGNSYTNPTKITADASTGDLVISGTNQGLADFNAGLGLDTLPTRNYCNFVYKTNNVGNPIWLKARPSGEDTREVLIDKLGNVYVLDESFAKYNADGTLRWDVDVNAGPRGGQYVIWNCAAQDNNGAIYAGGFFAYKHNFNVVSGVDSIAAPDAYDGFLMKLTDPTINVKPISVKQSIQYFPNPVNDNLQINSEKYLGKYSIKNAIGAEVLQGEIKGNSGTVFCEKLKPGIYFIQFENEEIKIVKS